MTPSSPDPENVNQPPVAAAGGDRLGMGVAVGLGLCLLLALWLLLGSDRFMAAQQAMFDAMAIMAEICRL
jgi:hypothetical protein